MPQWITRPSAPQEGNSPPISVSRLIGTGPPETEVVGTGPPTWGTVTV